MARITVEDCIDKFPSRFELVLVASNRARKLHSGESPTIEKDNDKNTVIALREIAQETLTKDKLKDDLIIEYQTTSFSDDEDFDEQDENLSDQENSEDSLIQNLKSEEQNNNSETEEDALIDKTNTEVTAQETKDISDEADVDNSDDAEVDSSDDAEVDNSDDAEVDNSDDAEVI